MLFRSVDDLRVTPDTARYRLTMGSDSVPPLLFDFRIEKFRIRGFKIMDFVNKRRIDVELIRLASPELIVYRMKIPAKKQEEGKTEKVTAIPLPKGLSGINISKFLVEKAKLTFIDCTGDSAVTNVFPETTITIQNIIVDSLHQGKKRLFNADDISINIGGYAFYDKKKMNRISFGEISVSTGKQEVVVKNFHLEPQFNNYDYPRKMGYQCDRTEVKIKELKLQRLKMREMLFEGKIMAGLVMIDSLLIDDYRDMRVADRPGLLPPLPQESIRKLKTYLKIDTVKVTNGKAIYYEQVNEKPGMIFFDRMKISITGLTNDSVLLAAGQIAELRGMTYLMGKGKIDATIRFRLGDRKNSFNYTVQIGPMDLREINAMLSYQIPGRIESGQLKKLVVPLVEANDDAAKGKLIFTYNDLKVMIENKETSTWSKIKTGVINFAANDLIVNNDNPTKSGKLKTGVIFFERNKKSSIFNFLWKSVFSGLKSTMGFNSKTQKEMIKEEKKGKK